MRITYAVILFALLLIVPQATTAATAQDAVKALAAGVESYKKGEYDKALNQFMVAREALPGDADLNYYIGMSYMKMGETERAAEFFRQTIEKNPRHNDARFQLATAHVLMHEYGEAVPHLEDLQSVQPDRENLGYLLGLSYYETGAYEKALKAFETNKTQDKTIKSLSLYYAGLSNVKLGRASEADTTYKELVRLDPTSPLAPSSQRLVDVLDAAAQERKRFRLNLTTKLQYDTNATLVPTTDVFNIRKNKHTTSVEFIYANAEYSLYKTRKADIRASYAFLQTLNNEVRDLDFQDHILSVSGVYKTSLKLPVYIIGTYTYDYALLNYRRYLQRNTVRPSVSVSWNKNNTTLLQYTFQLKEFRDTAIISQENRDAVNHDEGFVHYLRAASGRHHIYAGYFHDEEVAEGGNWDYAGDKEIVGAQATLPWNVKLNLDYSHKSLRYGYNSLFRKKRIDDNNTVSVIASKEVVRNVTVSLEYLYNRNHSSIPLYDYEKNLFSVGLNWKY